MTDLRQAAQLALEALVSGPEVDPIFAGETISALEQALVQPEQEPTQWRDMIVASLVREGISKHKARELADHFAAQRPWQGLTEEDWAKVAADMPDTFDQGAAWAQQRLKERNHD